jgi:hypothetical protein
MNYYQYLRALLFAIAMFAIGAMIVTANLAQAEERKGNIDQVIAALQSAKAKGVKDVVVVFTQQHDGPRDVVAYPIDAVGVIPSAPLTAGVLVVVGKGT